MKKSISKKSISKKSVGVLICCFFLSIVILCIKGSSNSIYSSSPVTFSSLNKVSSTSSKTTLHSGQSVTLSDGTLVCSSKENLSKMLSFMREKNKDGQNQMLINGQTTILSKGTKVNVINTGITAEIEVNGEKWFAPYELIK